MPAQAALIAAINRALVADARIDSAWLSGSLATGAGDAWSDVDIVAVAATDQIVTLVAEYAARSQDFAATVHCFTLYGRIVSAVTAEWMRFDLLFVTPEELAKRDASAHQPLFVRDGAAVPLGATPPPKPAPDEELTAGVREFLRVLGLAAVMAGRESFITGLDGAMLLRGLLIDLMLAENGRGRAERSVKRVTDMLTPAQSAAIAALPPLAATRASLIAFNAAIAALYLPRAKALFAARALPWPEAFEAATRAWLKAALDLSF